jgi:hypothetical protein
MTPILAAQPWHWWLGVFWLIVDVILLIGLGILYYRMVVAPTRPPHRSDVLTGRAATVGVGRQGRQVAADDEQAIARGLQPLAELERQGDGVRRNPAQHPPEVAVSGRRTDQVADPGVPRRPSSIR